MKTKTVLYSADRTHFCDTASIHDALRNLAKRKFSAKRAEDASEGLCANGTLCSPWSDGILGGFSATGMNWIHCCFFQLSFETMDSCERNGNRLAAYMINNVQILGKRHFVSYHIVDNRTCQHKQDKYGKQSHRILSAREKVVDSVSL